MDSTADLMIRFNHHPPRTPETADAHGQVRELLRDVALVLDQILPNGREKALATTKLEEAMMWANAAIARQPAKLDLAAASGLPPQD